VAEPLRLVAYLLTRKKAAKIGRSVTSLPQVTPQNVVDSESTYQTRTLSTDLGSDVIVHQFEGFSAQRNWALDYVEDQYRPDYVPSLDADECLSDDRTEEIRKRMANGSPDDHDAYLLHLHIRFARRTLRWRVSPTPGCLACPAPALGATRIEQSTSTLPSARLRLLPASPAPSRR
jgi:glycosyltransferase involved in cell wall biosynthesis